MLKFGKVLIMAISATAVMGLMVGTASANRLAASSNFLTATWTNMTFTDSLGGSAVCPVTLSGSLHSRTITKTPGALVGFLNRGTVGACTTGSATILQATLPWHLTYRGFTGTLPNIGSLLLNVINASFRVVTTSGFPCLFTSSATQPVIADFGLSGGVIRSVTVSGRLTSNEGCVIGARATGSLSGTSNTQTALTITL